MSTIAPNHWDVAEPADPTPAAMAAAWRVVLAVAVGALGTVLQARRLFAEPLHPSVATVLVAAVAVAVLALLRDRPVAILAWAAGVAALVPLRGTIQVGLTASVVAYLSATVAFATFSEWRPTRSWPRRTSSIAGLAVPTLVLAQLWWGRNHLVAPKIVALLAFSGLVTVAYQWWRAPLGRADHAFGHGLKVAADAIGLVILFLVVLPLLYLPGAVVRVVEVVRRRRAWGAGTSTWRPYDVTRAEERRDGAWGFASTPRAQRNRSAMAGVVVVALVAASLFGVVQHRRDQRAANVAVAAAARPPDDGQGGRTHNFIVALEQLTRYNRLPAMADAPWADDLQHEETAMPASGDSKGRYVNEVGGVRRTIRPPACPCKHVRVWWLGGSAAWGQGQRDDHTIASDMVRLAALDGIALDIVNLGSKGSTLSGEVGTLGAYLQDHEPPDLVVFYAGFNDALTNVSSEFVHGPGDYQAMSYEDVSAVNADADAFLQWRGGRAAAHHAAERMRGNVAMVEDLATRHRFQTAYFFQPDALASTAQLEGYEQLTGVSPTDMVASPLAQGLDQLSKDLRATFVSFRSLFADYPDPVFIGLVHQNEAGARMVAAATYGVLRDQLQSLAR